MTDEFPELDLTRTPHSLDALLRISVQMTEPEGLWEVRVAHNFKSSHVVAEGMTWRRAEDVRAHVWKMMRAARRLTAQ